MRLVEILIAVKHQLLFKIIFFREPKITVGFDLLELGSKYGSKVFSPGLLKSSVSPTLISAGCGEDISFDVEFLTQFSGETILIDPTPRAIEHVQQVTQNFGNVNSTPYTGSGIQPIAAYNLSQISKKNFFFEPKALWSSSTIISFYPPKNPEHVSYSISNLQSSGTDLNVLKVESITITEIMKIYKLTNIDILKLDIEGAQFEVLQNAFEESIFPTQIVLEIDEFCFPTLKNVLKGFRTFKLLNDNGYSCIANNGKFDYCFVKLE